MRIETDSKLFGYPTLAIVLFLLAAGAAASLLVSILMSDDTSKKVALGWHDDARMASDYKLVDEYLKMEKPYDIKTAYTNEFLDKSIKMPPINPPKLY